MQYNVDNPEQYIDQLTDDRKYAIGKLRKSIPDHLPKGFVETVNYRMLGFVGPDTLYLNGYHRDPKLPFPFMNISSQKNHIGYYLMGIYGNMALFDWFVSEFTTSFKSKLDMGKVCFRFKKLTGFLIN